MVVVASLDKEAREFVQNSLSSKFLRIYTQEDVIGVEVAGALKNILAIGAGIIEGLGYGINTSSAFVSIGCREIQMFAKRYNANPQTFLGLAGIGDLMLTGFGKLSRNRTFGYRIAKGEKIEDILKTSKGVVEGLPTLNVVIKYIEANNLDMPITKVIYNLVYGKVGPEKAIETLMLRKLKQEFKEFGLTEENTNN